MSLSKEFGSCATPMGSQPPCCLGEPLFRSRPARPAPRSRRTRPSAMAPRAGAPMSFADLAARLQPAVVNISTKQRVAGAHPGRPVRGILPPLRRAEAPHGASPAGARPAAAARATREAGSLGSGFIISPDGYVVTNNHLIQSASGTGTVDSVTVILDRPQGISGADRRPRRGLGPRLAQDRGQQPAVTSISAIQHPRPRRRLGDRDRQSLRPRRHRHRRDHLGAPPRDHRRRRLRPLHPDRRQHQHGQFAAARCSTWPATSSASIRR